MTARAPRLPLWRQIHDTLAAEIAGGRYRPGDRLPSEAQLSARFGVNRHTLRRGLAGLVDAGLIHVRRGAGATVTGRPLDYPLGARTRFGANLAAAGLVPGIRLRRLETLRASPTEVRHLALTPPALVHVVELVGLADGVPVSWGTSVFPAERFPELLVDLPRLQSVTGALRAGGLPDYLRRWTRLSADIARGAMARHLMCADGAPLLRATSLNVDPEGRPVEFGRHWFVSDRVALVVEGAGAGDPQPGMLPQTDPPDRHAGVTGLSEN
jgi:GntR family phosphonate transport system transcriptional regulator